MTRTKTPKKKAKKKAKVKAPVIDTTNPTTSRLSVDVKYDLHEELRNCTRYIQRHEDMDYAFRHLVIEALGREIRRQKRRLNLDAAEPFPPRGSNLKAGRRMGR